MSVYGGASAPPVPPAPSTVEGPALSTVEGSNVEGGQGHVPDEVAKQQQPAQMTLDFKTAPDPQVNPDPNVNPDPV
jgi:hypothetical protein